MRIPVELAFVAAGGATGASLRWGVAELVDTRTLATLVVNLVGCLLIGLAARAWPKRSGPAWWATVSGCLGGFTTFSAFAVDLRSLLADSMPLAAGASIMITFGGGVAAVELVRRSR